MLKKMILKVKNTDSVKENCNVGTCDSEQSEVDSATSDDPLHDNRGMSKQMDK
jgi:hypothetical protein